MPEETQIETNQALTTTATSEPPPDPPMSPAGVTPELMTPEEREAFMLKEHARILIAGGHATWKDALANNWISEADAAAWRLLGPEAYNEPSAVIQAPTNPPGRVKKTDAVETQTA